MTQPLTNTQAYYPQPAGANAVSINIFNPQAYGNAPQAAQAAPYGYTNSLYQMPQASTYQQQATPGIYQQYMPMQNPIAQAPVAPMPMAYPQVAQVPMQEPVAPAPQEMPESVMTAPVQQQEQQMQEVPAETQAPVEAQTQVQTPEIAEVQQTPEAAGVNIDELTQGLTSQDADKRAETINKIAEYAQAEPATALQVVSEPVMNGLISIINEDTTGLEGPTEQQIAVAEKIARGEQLTPEEDALSEQLSPRDKANKNRIFALYTLAMIQRLQRDELNQYIEQQKANGQQALEPLKIEELPGYNDIVNVIKNDARPEVQVAAMQALQYIAEPQDKAAVEAALADSLNSQDETVKAAAQEVISRFSAPEAQEGQQEVQAQEAQTQEAQNQEAQGQEQQQEQQEQQQGQQAA